MLLLLLFPVSSCLCGIEKTQDIKKNYLTLRIFYDS